jgi:hypothetical protein
MPNAPDTIRERKRRVLVIAPANLQRRSCEEVADKFFLPSAILENQTFEETVRRCPT